MKKLLLPIIVLLLSGCGKGFQVDPRTIVGVDGNLKPYVDMFESMYGRGISDISIGFGPTEYPVIGLCTRWSNGYRQITINQDYWDRASERERIGLIFHELGHCELNRDHATDTFYYSGSRVRGYVPVSIMYPYNFFSDYYSDLDSYYYNELFNPSASTTISNSLTSKSGGCVQDIELVQ